MFIHIPAKLEDPGEPLPSVPGTVTNGALVNVLGVGVALGATEGVAIEATESVPIGATEGVAMGVTEGVAIGAIEGVTTVCRKYNSIHSLKGLTLNQQYILN